MKLIGMEKELSMGLKALQKKQPVLYYGFTGNGKTLVAWNLAKGYGKESKIPVIYLQLYPEMTKNSLIGGETIKGGTIVIEEQAILTFGAKGAVFIIDECTHTTEPVLLAFNSLIEEPYSTVVGNKIYNLHEKTRFIFCGNYPDHAGNIQLPISFANRLYIVKVDMPSKEILVEIGKVANKESPNILLDFIADLIIKSYEPLFPVSPRNMVTCSINLSNTFKTGFLKEPHVNEDILRVCKKYNINLDILKETIISSLMGNIISKSQGPDKLKALLWE